MVSQRKASQSKIIIKRFIFMYVYMCACMPHVCGYLWSPEKELPGAGVLRGCELLGMDARK